MIIESSAPPRVDLAGGTIDIWPLYLFHPGAITVNFAISLHARCRIETRDDGRIVLESRDRKVSFETNLAALEDLLQEERLELISKLVHFFKPTTGFHLIAESEAPAGAGLGGSSALAIACIGALNRLVGNRYDERKFVTIASNVESTVIVTKHAPALPLYTEKDADASLELIKSTTNIGERFQVAPGITAGFSVSGHILG